MKLWFALLVVVSVVLGTLIVAVQSTPAQISPRRIEVTAKRFEFTPADITLKKGEPVVLVLKSVDVAHGIRFRELGIETKVGKGQTSELVFTPDKLGSFIGHCSVFCGSGHGSMMLTLHVVE